MPNFSSSYTPRPLLWTDWKKRYANGWGHQHQVEDGAYKIWFYDDPEVYSTTIWLGVVPPDLTGSYSQAQNDADKADFEAHYKSSSNGPLNVRTSDGKPISMPSLFPGGVFFYVTGAGDDIVAGNRGEGTPFQITDSSALPGDRYVEWYFQDWSYLSGGWVFWDGALVGDLVSIKINAPATPYLPNILHLGNANIDAATGIITPAAGNGGIDVDLNQAIPIPAVDDFTGASGFWDWSEPATGRGVVTSGADPGHAKWHLLGAPVTLVRFANKIRMFGSRMVLIEAQIKPKKILPHWTWRVDVHSVGRTSGALNVSWALRTGRARTT